MKERQPVKWNRLDNAAKIFPPTSTKRDTKVFRFVCELNEPVEKEPLQRALDRTMALFPFYRSILKKGLFWYYLEESDLPAVVRQEDTPPCSQLYDRNVRSLLFDVTYYQCRINLEIYHALSDGTGALQFLRVLVYQYLMDRHGDALGEVTIDYDASMTQKMDDSFQKYYLKSHKHIRSRPLPAYKIKGFRLPENRIRIIEGSMPVKAVLEGAHACGATLTAFVAAVLLCAIRDTMSLRDRRRPVVLTIPVNLRQYFSSESARNFFSTLEYGQMFDAPLELNQVAARVMEHFKKELTAERMGLRMNELAAIEHNVFVRPVPLGIKDLVLRLASAYTERGITAALSNIGKIQMPQALCPYIRLFDVFVSTKRVQICMCSFEENLNISFSSPFESTEIQKNFFRTLTGMGIPVRITASRIGGERGEDHEKL